MTITEADELDADGFPKRPASACLEPPPQRQCYTAPKDFGWVSTADVVQLDKDTPALFFCASSGPGSGESFHCVLLRPGTGKNLDNILFIYGPLSNLSRHAFWNDASIPEAAIFITADFVWGPDESHYGEHRYIISSYVRTFSSGGFYYYLNDRYMTIRKYGPQDPDVLAAEKPEILARLRRVKGADNSRKRVPR